jgi:hypothetical protein
MLDIDGGADRALARLEERLQGIERGILHDQDHDRRRQGLR